MCTSTNITFMALFLNFYDVALSKVDFYDLKTWGVTTSSTWNNKKQTLNKPILGLEFSSLKCIGRIFDFLFFISIVNPEWFIPDSTPTISIYWTCLEILEIYYNQSKRKINHRNICTMKAKKIQNFDLLYLSVFFVIFAGPETHNSRTGSRKKFLIPPDPDSQQCFLDQG